MLSVRLLRVPYTRRSHLSAAQTLDVIRKGLAHIKLKNTSAIRIRRTHLCFLIRVRLLPPLRHSWATVKLLSPFHRARTLRARDAGYSSALLRYVGDLNARVLTPLRID